jgi:hypothetical protein
LGHPDWISTKAQDGVHPTSGVLIDAGARDEHRHIADADHQRLALGQRGVLAQVMPAFGDLTQERLGLVDPGGLPIAQMSADIGAEGWPRRRTAEAPGASIRGCPPPVTPSLAGSRNANPATSKGVPTLPLVRTLADAHPIDQHQS